MIKGELKKENKAVSSKVILHNLLAEQWICDSWNLAQKQKFHDKFSFDNEIKTLDLINFKI